jgi:hypothetical protein
MAGFKDGSGNTLFVWSNAKGTVVRGYDEDNGVSPSLEGFPKSLARAIHEPAFGGDEELTFVWWKLVGDKHWYGTAMPRRGVGEELVAMLGANVGRWLELYYGEDIASAANAIISAKTVTPKLVDALRARVKPPKKPKLTKKATKKSKAPPKKRARPSFGQAEFVVQCEPTYVQMVIHGKQVVARANEDVYLEIFDWVKARLKRAARGG